MTFSGLTFLYGKFLSHVKYYVSVSQLSRSVVSDSLQPHGLQQARLPCPSPTPGASSNSSPLSQWCHTTILSSVVPFSSCLQSFPPAGSFQMSQFFASGGWSIGTSASASVPPMDIQDWFPLGWTGWISLQSKGLSRVFSNITVQKHQFFSDQPSLCLLRFYISTWIKFVSLCFSRKLFLCYLHFSLIILCLSSRSLMISCLFFVCDFNY